MRVPLLDLSEQYRSIAEPLRQRIAEVFASQRFILGPNVEKFEKAMCDFTGAPHAIGVSSGTDALLAAYMALGIGRGDAVVTTSYTFFATAGCIARVGATPVFVDIDPATYQISPRQLAEFLAQKCARKGDTIVLRQTGEIVRAIVPVHLFGTCCDMDSIQRIAEEYQLAVIEDAAQAIGTDCPFGSGAKQAGTMGKVGCFSFYPSKNLGAAGDAGLIVCGEKELAEKIRAVREHGMQPRYFHHLIGGNFRLDEIQAAVLDLKLSYLADWSARRRAAADFYGSKFNEAGLGEKIGLPPEPHRDRGLQRHHIFHQYVIRFPRREALRKHLTKREIGTAVYYPLGLHQQECFAHLGYRPGDLPETERAAAETLALPLFPEISPEAQSYVVNSIAEFLS
jgi:dTDP-4-amino-4,6-dideoxygalactose transaminase